MEACQSVLDVLKKRNSIKRLPTEKACAFWITNNVFRRPVPAMTGR